MWIIVSQCDQMTRLFLLNIWPFAAIDIWSSAQLFGRNTWYEKFRRKMPKTVLIVPKWRNFVKSGHTDRALGVGPKGSGVAYPCHEQ